MKQKYEDRDISCKEYRDYVSINRGYKDFNEYQNMRNHIIGRCQPMSENKNCSSYLGVHIGERVVTKIWDKAIRMPNNTIGYDWTCPKGFKIQQKTSCICKSKVIRDYGSGEYIYDTLAFTINKNNIADYFLLVAFNNRYDLEPFGMWLFKKDDIVRGRKFNKFKNFKVTLSKIDELKKYEVSDKLEKLKECCSSLKGDSIFFVK